MPGRLPALPAAAAPDAASSTDAYARRFAGAVGEAMLAAQTAALAAALAPWPGARVLDVGGGHAQVAVPLAERGHPVTVLASAAGLHRRVRRHGGGTIRCVVGDLADPPFADGAFDLVVAFRLLAHAPDWRRLVGGLCRVARLAVLVDFPPLGSANLLAPWLFWLKLRVERSTRRYRVLRSSRVAAELRAQGFAAVREQRQLFFPLALHRLVGSPRWTAAGERVARAAGLTAVLGSPAVMLGRRTPAPGDPPAPRAL